MRWRVLVVLAFLLVAALAGCGGGSGNATSSPTATARSSSTSSGTPSSTSPTSTPPPGCGTYCISAGPSGGPNPDECPNYRSPNGACKQCPTAGCAELRSDAGVVRNGSAEFVVRCMLSEPCTGAFLVFRPGEFTAPGTPLPRLAQSDLKMGANSEATVKVALTAHGRQLLAAAPRGLRGTAYIALDPYGPVLKPDRNDFPGQPVSLTGTP